MKYKKKIVAASAALVASSSAAFAQDAGFAETLAGTVDTSDILAGMAALGTLALGLTLAYRGFIYIRRMLAGS